MTIAGGPGVALGARCKGNVRCSIRGEAGIGQGSNEEASQSHLDSRIARCCGRCCARVGRAASQRLRRSRSGQPGDPRLRFAERTFWRRRRWVGCERSGRRRTRDRRRGRWPGRRRLLLSKAPPCGRAPGQADGKKRGRRFIGRRLEHLSTVPSRGNQPVGCRQFRDPRALGIGPAVGGLGAHGAAVHGPALTRAGAGDWDAQACW
jgi:hypothetical protein